MAHLTVAAKKVKQPRLSKVSAAGFGMGELFTDSVLRQSWTPAVQRAGRRFVCSVSSELNKWRELDVGEKGA